MYSRYVNNRKGLVFFVFRQPAPSERTRQSGTGRTSPVREIWLENAQMRLARGWQCGCARVPLAFRNSVTPFQCFPRGCERPSWVQGRCCRTLSTLNFSSGYLLIISARQQNLIFDPSIDTNFFIFFFFFFTLYTIYSYLYRRD